MKWKWSLLNLHIAIFWCLMFGVSECFSPTICCGSIMKTVVLSHNQWTSSKLGETSTSNVNSNSAIVCHSQSSIQSSVDVEMRKSKVKSWRLERESVVKFADLSINHTMDAKTFVSNYHIWNAIIFKTRLHLLDPHLHFKLSIIITPRWGFI